MNKISSLLIAFVALTALADPIVTIGERNGNTLPLSFEGVDAPMVLCVAYGAQASDSGLAGWSYVDVVMTLDAGATEFDYTLPTAWDDTVRAIQFFLIDGDLCGRYAEKVISSGATVPLSDILASPYMVIRMKFNLASMAGGSFIGYSLGDDNDDYRFFGYQGSMYMDVISGRLNTSPFLTGQDYEFELGNIYVRDIANGKDILRGEPINFVTAEYRVLNIFSGGDYGSISYIDIYDKGDVADELALTHALRPAVYDGKNGFFDQVTHKFYTDAEGKLQVEGAGSGIVTGAENVQAVSTVYLSENSGKPLVTELSFSIGGDSVVVSGILVNQGAGDVQTVVEISRDEKFRTKMAYEAVDDELGKRRAVISEQDPSSPFYLRAGASFYYRICAVDSEGNTYVSAKRTFTLPENFRQAPVLWRDPLAINGMLLVPTLKQNQSYTLQRLVGGEWQTASDIYAMNFSDTSIRFVAGPTGLDGLSTWRIGFGTNPDAWTEFTIDAHHPILFSNSSMQVISGFEPYNDQHTASNAFSCTFNTAVHSKDPNNGTKDDFYFIMDFGEEKTICGFTLYGLAHLQYAYRASPGYFEISDNVEFTENVRIIKEVSTPKAHMEHWEFPPVTTRYARYRREPLARSDYFNFVQFEVDEYKQEIEPNLRISVPDYETFYPELHVTPGYEEDGGVTIYRSMSATEGFEIVGTMEKGSNTWIDADSTLKYGRCYWYRVGDDVVPFTRLRRLPKSRILQLNGARTDNPAYSVENLFDGKSDTFADIAGYDQGNPALGVTFDQPYHLALCRYLPRQDTYGYSRSVGVCVFTSSADEDAEADEIYGGRVRVSEPFPDISCFGIWWDFYCDAAADVTSHAFVAHPHGAGWLGNAAELEFYGFTEKDINPPGLTILIR